MRAQELAYNSISSTQVIFVVPHYCLSYSHRRKLICPLAQLTAPLSMASISLKPQTASLSIIQKVVGDFALSSTQLKYISTVIQMEIDSLTPPEPSENIPQRRRFEFAEPQEPRIFFNSCFDSGNMHKVIRNAHDHYSIWTACDAQGTANEGHPKSWFYFEVGGFINRRVAFSVHRVHFLCALAKKHHLYRPVYRVTSSEGERGEWLRLDHPVLSLGLAEGQMTLKFDYLFGEGQRSVEFAFIYPYTYQECREDVQRWREEFENDKEIFLQHFELTKSVQGRVIDCVMISSHEGKEGFQAVRPQDGKRITRFRANKPIIFISARVHPIETPSSFCMKGIIQFLLDKQDMRAHLLRKYFVFLLVPMLNPDGVARGHCRMDTLNQNLNRYYSTPDPQNQPSCWAVKQLWQHYSQEQRLFMYVDLHAHPALKGNFAFGNAIYEFVEQVESQVFPRTLAANCVNFQFEQCIFSRKHMKARDRNEQQTKEGCGRVVLYKEFGIVHSYTVECGYHLNAFDNAIAPPANTATRYLVRYRLNERGEKIFDPAEKAITQEKYERMKEEGRETPKGYDLFAFTAHPLDDPHHAYYQRELPSYEVETFANLGRNLVISLLDIWGKNPYSRIEDVNVQRREIAERQGKLDRFRKEQAGIKTKQRRIVELIEEQFYGEWHRRNVFNPHLVEQRDKRRNNTLQAQKPNLARPTRSEKGEKAKEQASKLENIAKAAQDERNCETIETDLLESHPTTTIKLSLKEGNEGVLEGRAGSKNFKLSRINFAACLAHDKQTTRPLRDLIGTQLKLTTENELPRSNNDVLSVHSKAMRIPNCNLRVRNVAALALVRGSDDSRAKPVL